MHCVSNENKHVLAGVELALQLQGDHFGGRHSVVSCWMGWNPVSYDHKPPQSPMRTWTYRWARGAAAGRRKAPAWARQQAATRHDRVRMMLGLADGGGGVVVANRGEPGCVVYVCALKKSKW